MRCMQMRKLFFIKIQYCYITGCTVQCTHFAPFDIFLSDNYFSNRYFHSLLIYIRMEFRRNRVQSRKNFLIQYMTKHSRISSYIFEYFHCKGLCIRFRSLPYFFVYVLTVYEENFPIFFGGTLDMTCSLYSYTRQAQIFLTK